MRKLSLLLSLLLSFVSMVSLSHASSGDITIWTKTYTQSEAQKQIVEPLLKRLERQKIAKTKIRLINLTIRQYTNKQKIAQKQGKTDLIKFYNGIIDTLKWKVNTIGTGSLNGGTENSITKINESLTKNPITQSPWLNSWAWIWGNGTNDYNGMTQEQKEKAITEQAVNSYYNSAKAQWTTQSQFLSYMKTKYGESSYAYQYAQTLSFGSSSQGTSNQWGLWTTSNQTGLSWVALEQSNIIWNVNWEYQNIDLSVVSKAQFLQYISDNYGWTNSYAYQYAKTLSFSK